MNLELNKIFLICFLISLPWEVFSIEIPCVCESTTTVAIDSNCTVLADDVTFDVTDPNELSSECTCTVPAPSQLDYLKGPTEYTIFCVGVPTTTEQLTTLAEITTTIEETTVEVTTDPTTDITDSTTSSTTTIETGNFAIKMEN